MRFEYSEEVSEAPFLPSEKYDFTAFSLKTAQFSYIFQRANFSGRIPFFVCKSNAFSPCFFFVPYGTLLSYAPSRRANPSKRVFGHVSGISSASRNAALPNPASAPHRSFLGSLCRRLVIRSFLRRLDIASPSPRALHQTAPSASHHSPLSSFIYDKNDNLFAFNVSIFVFFALFKAFFIRFAAVFAMRYRLFVSVFHVKHFELSTLFYPFCTAFSFIVVLLFTVCVFTHYAFDFITFVQL